MDPAGGSSLATLADIHGWSLNAEKEKVKATAFGDTNHVKVVGLPDFSGNIKGRYARDSTPALFAAVLGSTPVTLRLIEDSQQLTYYHQGLAHLDGTITVDHDGVVDFNGSWDAAGNWTQNP
jgi:hypothetical protein